MSFALPDITLTLICPRPESPNHHAHRQYRQSSLSKFHITTPRCNMADQHGADQTGEAYVVSLCEDFCKSPTAPVGCVISHKLDMSTLFCGTVNGCGTPVLALQKTSLHPAVSGCRLHRSLDHGNRTLISEWSNDCSRRLGGYPTFG